MDRCPRRDWPLTTSTRAPSSKPTCGPSSCDRAAGPAAAVALVSPLTQVVSVERSTISPPPAPLPIASARTIPLWLTIAALQVDAPAAGGDAAEVQHLALGCADTHRDVRHRAVGELHALACGQQDLPPGCFDQAFVAHAAGAADQHHLAAPGRAQFTLVHDGRAAAGWPSSRVSRW
jgi:hypothetical protein